MAKDPVCGMTVDEKKAMRGYPARVPIFVPRLETRLRTLWGER